MLQDILVQSAVQRYLLGMKYNLNLWRFRYSKATVALAGLKRLVINSNYCPGVTGHENEDGFEGAGGVNAYAASIGQRYLDIKDTALRVKNFYQGGMVTIAGTTIFHEHYIVKSDVGTGTYVRLYLDVPIAVEDITAAMGVSASRSAYSAVQPAASVQVGFETFVGVNLIPVTINYFFWLLTKGPVSITPTGTPQWPGAAANMRDVYANPSDGTIQNAPTRDPSLGYQRIGTIIQATGGTGSDYGSNKINLDLDPE